MSVQSRYFCCKLGRTNCIVTLIRKDFFRKTFLDVVIQKLRLPRYSNITSSHLRRIMRVNVREHSRSYVKVCEVTWMFSTVQKCLLQHFVEHVTLYLKSLYLSLKKLRIGAY